MANRTVIHLLRHGEVYNPDGVLYGRLPNFHLSELGREMAQRVADATADRDIVTVMASPMERAQETAAPIAAAHDLPIEINENLIEGDNKFEGQVVGGPDRLLKNPQMWRHLWNPLRPSWGEPYAEIAQRMLSAIDLAREEAAGHEALLVSHQLPIWIARLDLEDRNYVHDPRSRQCALASLTSLTYTDDVLTAVVYTEPAADLVEKSNKGVGA
ncbi:MAG: histidine phosphatase family protein [Actinomycetia bacterium]|nr:histidine phosphatase family protein [Actinomycetes bacterium]